MSYGKTKGEQRAENTFQTGINECYMTRFEAQNSRTDKYDGPVLQVTWTNDDGSEINERKFPVNEAQIRAEYRKDPSNSRNQVYDPSIKAKRQGTEDEIVDRAYAKLNDWIEHVITAYVPEDVYNTAIANMPDNTTFVQFIEVMRQLLPPTFGAVKGHLRVGYQKNSKYMSTASAMYMGGSFWSTNLEARPLKVVKNDYFHYDGPWGEKIEAANNAPAQDTGGETNF